MNEVQTTVIAVPRIVRAKDTPSAWKILLSRRIIAKFVSVTLRGSSVSPLAASSGSLIE